MDIPNAHTTRLFKEAINGKSMATWRSPLNHYRDLQNGTPNLEKPKPYIVASSLFSIIHILCRPRRRASSNSWRLLGVVLNSYE